MLVLSEVDALGTYQRACVAQPRLLAAIVKSD